jgi:excisionase family DNA binding protein
MTTSSTTPVQPEFLSMKDSALRIGVSLKFIEKVTLAHGNPLPSFKLGRRRLINIKQLDEWMMKHAA